MIKRSTLFYAIAAALASGPALSQDLPAGHERQWELVDDYCLGCHNIEDWAGSLAFDTLSPGTIPEEADTWELALRKLRGRLMPPPGSPQPEQAEIDQFVAWMENTLDSEAQGPRAGHVPVQRLTRNEYALAVKDLLAVEIDAAEFLPTEMEVDGFDNMAAALSVSPAFLDQFIAVARHVANLAVGDPNAKLSNSFYPAPGGSQASFEDGFPLGTRGGMRFQHHFPADGDYRLNILDLDVGLYPRGIETAQTLVVLIDGEEIFRANLGGEEDIRLVDREGVIGATKIMERFKDIPATVKAGAHDVVVTFIERSQARSDSTVDNGGFGGSRVARLLDGVEVVGPYAPSGISLTPSRAKIFTCQPQSAAEELSCAQRITADLARRAYRRPVEQGDVDLLMPFFEQGRQEGGFENGIEQVVAAVLASPDFLYRSISVDKDIGAAQAFALNDLELASRLSFFLWSQGPDEELLSLASANQLSQGDTLEQQLRRMLADPRAQALVKHFALKWLNLDDLDAVQPEPAQFPGFSSALREDFAQEIQLFLASILLEDRPVTELLHADHSFLNERLARHYGIEDVFGAQFRRVTLSDPARFGLLGKGAVLLRTSYGDRTSPVLRGAWVLEKLMGTPPSPPPPNVETDLSVIPGQLPTTVRARLEEHRANPSCNQCHGVIDPIGLALENFDVTGMWRDEDRQARVAIDASTVMPTGVAIEGPVELRRELMHRPEQFAQAITEKLMMYGLARELEYHDMPQVRAIVRAAAEQDYRLSAIILGIVQSDAFRLQSLPHVAEQGQDPAQVALHGSATGN